MSERKRNPIEVSPVGLAKYPRLVVPDTKYKKEGEYSLRLLVPEADAEAFVGKLKAHAKSFYEAECQAKKKKALKRAPLPFKPEVTTDDSGIETKTGNIEFKATLRAKIPGRTEGEFITLRPKIENAKGELCPKLNVGSGSRVKIAVEVRPWFTEALGFGIKLSLRAVRVLELVEWKAEEQDYFGAGEEGFDGGTSESDFGAANESPADEAQDGAGDAGNADY